MNLVVMDLVDSVDELMEPLNSGAGKTGQKSST